MQPEIRRGDTTANTGSSDWLARFALVVTVLLHLILQRNGPNLYFIAGACLFWIGFLIWHFAFDRVTAARWGFTGKQLRAAARDCLLVFAAIAGMLAIYAAVQGQLRVTGGLFAQLVLYPFYGLVQQFVVLGIVWSATAARISRRGGRVAASLLIAALFGLLHAPETKIMLATALLEIVSIAIYARHRNLWPIGVLHGWCGALWYLWFEGRDMWTENLRMLQ